MHEIDIVGHLLTHSAPRGGCWKQSLQTLSRGDEQIKLEWKLNKLQKEFDRLLAAVRILDEEWTAKLRRACVAAGKRRFAEDLLYKSAIAAITHRLTVGYLNPAYLVESYLAVKRKYSLPLSEDEDEWCDQILALVAVWPSQTEANLVNKFLPANRNSLFSQIAEMIATGDLRVDQREHYRLIFLPNSDWHSTLSNRQLADHHANVHGLSYKAIGARIKGGMTPLEALTTPRLRKESETTR